MGMIQGHNNLVYLIAIFNSFYIEDFQFGQKTPSTYFQHIKSLVSK